MRPLRTIVAAVGIIVLAAGCSAPAATLAAPAAGLEDHRACPDGFSCAPPAFQPVLQVAPPTTAVCLDKFEMADDMGYAFLYDVATSRVGFWYKHPEANGLAMGAMRMAYAGNTLETRWNETATTQYFELPWPLAPGEQPHLDFFVGRFAYDFTSALGPATGYDQHYRIDPEAEVGLFDVVHTVHVGAQAFHFREVTVTQFGQTTLADFVASGEDFRLEVSAGHWIQGSGTLFLDVCDAS